MGESRETRTVELKESMLVRLFGRRLHSFLLEDEGHMGTFWYVGLEAGFVRVYRGASMSL